MRNSTGGLPNFRNLASILICGNTTPPISNRIFSPEPQILLLKRWFSSKVSETPFSCRNVAVFVPILKPKIKEIGMPEIGRRFYFASRSETNSLIELKFRLEAAPLHTWFSFRKKERASAVLSLWRHSAEVRERALKRRIKGNQSDSAKIVYFNDYYSKTIFFIALPHTVGKLRLSAFQWCMFWIMLLWPILSNLWFFTPAFPIKCWNILLFP